MTNAKKAEKIRNLLADVLEKLENLEQYYAAKSAEFMEQERVLYGERKLLEYQLDTFNTFKQSEREGENE